MSNSQVLRSTAVDPRFQFLQTGFHAFDETFVHRLLLLTSIRTAGENERLVPIGVWDQLDRHTGLDLLPLLLYQMLFILTQRRLGVPTIYDPWRSRRYFRSSSLNIPRSITQIRLARPYFASMASTIDWTVLESFLLPSNTS